MLAPSWILSSSFCEKFCVNCLPSGSLTDFILPPMIYMVLSSMFGAGLLGDTVSISTRSSKFCPSRFRNVVIIGVFVKHPSNSITFIGDLPVNSLSFSKQFIAILLWYSMAGWFKFGMSRFLGSDWALKDRVSLVGSESVLVFLGYVVILKSGCISDVPCFDASSCWRTRSDCWAIWRIASSRFSVFSTTASIISCIPLKSSLLWNRVSPFLSSGAALTLGSMISSLRAFIMRFLNASLGRWV